MPGRALKSKVSFLDLFWIHAPGQKRVLVNGSNAVSHRSPAFQSDFEIDLEHCPNCGGEIEIIVAIFESAVIERLLTHVGL